MPDIISLLPENVANQIAAGEVVQRPASIVKELLENSVDAGASSIKLIVKDGGKTLVQVIDNGKGMSETDARMCFERHATSKLKTAEDLFNILTKGFRGEALAAISAVAQVELKTRTVDSSVGILIENEGNKIVKQEPCSCAVGTSFSVKNIFFNIPARRNFLKNDNIELKHIVDEFERVALAHPEVSFSLFNNNHEMYHLQASQLIVRIESLFSSSIKGNLVAVNEVTPGFSIKGYVGKPSAAKKKRGEQYFFVNNRFIKSPYLNYAVSDAYTDLINGDEFPAYFIFIDLPPNTIDINIHPTKTEIKFEDEKTLFVILKTAVKRALGKANLAPSLDFDTEQSFEIDYSKPKEEIKAPQISYNPDYNPFKSNSSGGSTKNYESSLYKNNKENWQELYQTHTNPIEHIFETEQEQEQLFEQNKNEVKIGKLFQLHNKYIVTETSEGLMLVDQHRAHESVLYEHYLKAFGSNAIYSQQDLFPQTVDLSPIDFNLIQELKEELKYLGFEIENFGKTSIVVHGVPADLTGQNSIEMIEGILENYKLNNIDVKLEVRENLCRSIAKKTCIQYGKDLSANEMLLLVEHLFSLENYSFSPSGKAIVSLISISDIDKLFKKR
ncbi:MAG: DNA mismatch repair endonuclease MutL [Bacteroidota bacterium]|nr:DNA mismatch repair endonuclease MutL [Bacteroidota bacterium]